MKLKKVRQQAIDKATELGHTLTWQQVSSDKFSSQSSQAAICDTCKLGLLIHSNGKEGGADGAALLRNCRDS